LRTSGAFTTDMQIFIKNKTMEKIYYATEKNDVLYQDTRVVVNGSIVIDGMVPVKITQHVFDEWLEKQMISENHGKSILRTDHVLSAVCLFSNMKRSSVLMNTRKREIILQRQYAHYLAMHFKTDSSVDIGYKIGNKDHATVLHSRNTIQNYIDVYDKHRIHIDKIINYLKRNYITKKITR
jgi:chromosomal replication initiation ATPase DnaA